MIKAKELKDWLSVLKDDAVIGIEDNLLIARDPGSAGWEDELEVGHLDPLDDDD
jgi:hypothetical protein